MLVIAAPPPDIPSSSESSIHPQLAGRRRTDVRHLIWCAVALSYEASLSENRYIYCYYKEIGRYETPRHKTPSTQRLYPRRGVCRSRRLRVIRRCAFCYERAAAHCLKGAKRDDRRHHDAPRANGTIPHDRLFQYRRLQLRPEQRRSKTDGVGRATRRAQRNHHRQRLSLDCRRHRLSNRWIDTEPMGAQLAIP